VTAATSADPSALCEEILAEGKRRAEGILEEARREGETILARARAEAETFRRETLEAARTEAARRRDRVLAGVPIDVARTRAAQVEALLESLRARALGELLARRGFDYREAVISLAADALRRMTGQAFVVNLSVGYEADLGTGLAEEVLRRSNRAGLSLTLSEDPSITEVGFIVRDVEGRQVWDDRLAVRLGRLWPALRLPLAIGAGLVEPEGRAL
jgi:vacuolar-type H+-ATPase subunit E/Vma4